MKIAYVVFTIALVVLSGLPLLSSGTMNYANAITGKLSLQEETVL
jgi:hypothetical protein